MPALCWALLAGPNSGDFAQPHRERHPVGDDGWGGKPRGSPGRGGACQKGWLWLRWGTCGRAGLGCEGSPSPPGSCWPSWGLYRTCSVPSPHGAVKTSGGCRGWMASLGGSLGSEGPVGEGRNYPLILELRGSWPGWDSPSSLSLRTNCPRGELDVPRKLAQGVWGRPGPSPCHLCSEEAGLRGKSLTMARGRRERNAQEGPGCGGEELRRGLGEGLCLSPPPNLTLPPRLWAPRKAL